MQAKAGEGGVDGEVLIFHGGDDVDGETLQTREGGVEGVEGDEEKCCC